MLISKTDNSKVNWQDFFLHETIRNHSDLLYPARILSFSIVALLVVTLASPTAVFTLPELQSLRDITLITCIICFILFAYALYRLKYKAAYELSGFITVAVAVVAVIATGVITGGPSNSPIFQFLIGPSILAYFLGGASRGLATALLSLFSLIVLGAIGLSGSAFPEFYVSPAFERTVLFGNLFLVVSLAFIYEKMSIDLHTELERQQQQYTLMATTDSLTGLANRRVFDEAVAARITLYESMETPRYFTLCYLDLDRFKPINDVYGHSVGDEVLVAIARKLQVALKGADFIGRHGGDEFVMLLNDTHEPEAIAALARRYLKLIREPISTSVGNVELDGSLGFATYPDHGSDLLTLSKAADSAMYKAKQTGTGYFIFDR